MIIRIWKGWTTTANAPLYEKLLLNEILPGIAARELSGYRGISLMKRPLGSEVEFVTVMWFDDFDSVRAFAGADFDRAVVPDKARELLSRFDATSAHYETVVPPPGMG